MVRSARKNNVAHPKADFSKNAEFKIQILVKDGLDVRSRIDQQGIFKNSKTSQVERNKSPSQKVQASSQELTLEETTGLSQQFKKFMIPDSKENNQLTNCQNGNFQPDFPLSQNNSTYNKLFHITSLLDQLSQSSLRQTKRTEAVTKLKSLIQDLIKDNQQMKQKQDLSSGNEESGEEITLRIKPLKEGQANLDSAKAISEQFIEQTSSLQAKIWTLQSENDLLNQKLFQMIEDREKKDYQLKTINHQLMLMLQDLQPKSAYSNTMLIKNQIKKNGAKGFLKSPQSYKDEDNLYKSNMNSASKVTKAESLGMVPRSRNKCLSQNQFQKQGSLNGGIVIAGLESIESDIEGEDLQLTLKKKSTKKNINDDLFEQYDDQDSKNQMLFEENKQFTPHVHQNISELEGDMLEDEYMSSSGENQSQLINIIKDQMENLRRLSKSQKKITDAPSGKSLSSLRKKSYVRDQRRKQESKSFRNSDQDRQSSMQRSVSLGVGSHGGAPLQTEPSQPTSNMVFLTAGYGGNQQQQQQQRSNSSNFTGKNSDTPSGRSNSRFGLSQTRDRRFEPKSNWEPNEQGGECSLCKGKFSLLKRKHHCRKCGLLVCGTCSGNNWYVPGYKDKKVRMCDSCYKQWMAYKVSSHNINKTSVFSSYFGHHHLTPS